jgi:hypothetical protein
MVKECREGRQASEPNSTLTTSSSGEDTAGILTKSIRSQALVNSVPFRCSPVPIRCGAFSLRRFSTLQLTANQSLTNLATTIRLGTSLATRIPRVPRRARTHTFARLLANAVRTCRDPLSARAHRGSLGEVTLPRHVASRWPTSSDSHVPAFRSKRPRLLVFQPREVLMRSR